MHESSSYFAGFFVSTEPAVLEKRRSSSIADTWLHPLECHTAHFRVHFTVALFNSGYMYVRRSTHEFGKSLIFHVKVDSGGVIASPEKYSQLDSSGR